MASVYKRTKNDQWGGRYWYASYRDANGQRRIHCTQTTDKAAALRIANKLEADAALRRDGVIDAAADRIAAEERRPLVDHLRDFCKALEAKGNAAEYIDQTIARAEFIIGKCAATFPKDLTASAVQQAVRSIRDNGKSIATANAYLRSIKGLSRWLFRDKRTRDDVLMTLGTGNESSDKRHVRRELSGDEFNWLIHITERRTENGHSLPGPDRAMLYRLAVGTGLRAGELRSLTPTSFDLDSEHPTVTVAAAYSKRRTTDVQPLSKPLAESLRPWLDRRAPDERLFARFTKHGARTLRGDLAAARKAWIEAAKGNKAERKRREESDFLEYRNAAGEVFDFHSFRHSFVSFVVRGGASVKVAQELARHSSPTLTIGRYSHARLHDLQGALEGLPTGARIGDEPDEPKRIRATGTAGIEPPPTKIPDSATDSAQGAKRCLVDAKPCEDDHTADGSMMTMSEGQEDKKPAGKRGLKRHDAASCESGGHGSRTRNRLPGITFPVALAICPGSSANARSRTRLRSSGNS